MTLSSALLSNSNNENYTTSEIIVAIDQQLDHKVTISPSVSITDNDETLDIFDIMTKTNVNGRDQQHNSSARRIIEINFNDPPSWPCINDKIRCHLIEHGPDQGKYADFCESTSEDGRKFSGDCFFKKLFNGETIEHNWLIYSETMLYQTNIANQKVGFNDWKNLNRVVEHENSTNHRENFCKWKSLQKRLLSGECADDALQKAIETDKQKWRQILKIILDAVMFCAKNNLPLRGLCSSIENPNSGIFLNLLEFINHYDVQLKQHIVAHKKGSESYFSPAIQNEFIGLLANQVHNEIISKIKKLNIILSFWTAHQTYLIESKCPRL
ncbi:hypothetical protein KIL84_007906 [Mauremys mutica]|uniref:Zinc finger MYM-type protein 1-like n=1 Tax=Mauremys mutica TaxID=74926 RepID=A0A9D4AVI6_9SAUR|nr:hypothetical protein KIL84_007906 [Mauremys mutica]